jgi:hypothetical protein
MSTEATTATPEVTPKATPTEPVKPTEPTTTPAVEEPLGESGLKALQAEREARKAAEKRIADFEKAEQEREQAAMSELEKANARAEAAEKSAAEAAAQVLRARVASVKKVDADLLTGSTEEELTASADKLLAWKGTTPSVPSAAGQGNVGEPIQGSKQLTKEDVAKLTASKDYAAIEEARQAGLLADVLSGKS